MVKYTGGNSNRHWNLELANSSQKLSEPRFQDFGELKGREEVPQALASLKPVTRRQFVTRKGLGEVHPRVYYRKTGRGWSILTYQGRHDAAPGPTEIVGREQLRPDRDTAYGEGYFCFYPSACGFGGKWFPTDQEGRTGLDRDLTH